MALPLRPPRSAELMLEGLSQLITVEWRSMPVAARLELPAVGSPVLYLDSATPVETQTVALFEALGAIMFGPEVAASGRRARHLHSIS